MSSSTTSLSRQQPVIGHCPLLSLPAEIRNMIWEYSVQVDHIQAIQHNAATSPKRNNAYVVPINTYTMTFETRDRANWRTMPQDLATLLSLQDTCRQVRNEVGDLPFFQNIFDVGLHAIQHFLAVVPQRILDNIKVITIWKAPGRKMTSIGEMHCLADYDENYSRTWRLQLGLLKELPALKKVILHVRGGRVGSGLGPLSGLDFGGFTKVYLPCVLERNVEVVSI